MNDAERIATLAHESHDIRLLTLLEAACSICRYCSGSKGHKVFPSNFGERWHHMFTVGNGSNPCAAGPIWNLIVRE